MQPRDYIALDLERVDMQIFKIGDYATVKFMRYRKWWQVWKPRYWVEQRVYEVVGASTTNFDCAIGEIHISGGGVEQIREI